MALQTQNVEIPFATGDNSKSDPRWNPNGQTTITNGHLGRPGSVRKRNGFGCVDGVSSYTAITQNGSTLAADTKGRAFPFADGAATINTKRLWALSRASRTLTDLDAVTPFVARRYGVAAVPKAITSFDMAITGTGLVVYAYCSNGRLSIEVWDRSSGQIVARPNIAAVAGTADYVKLVTISSGGRVFVCTQTSGSPANIQVGEFSLTSMTLPSVTAVVTTCQGAQWWDAAAWDGTSPPATFVLAWSDLTGGVSTYKVATVSATPAIVASATFTPAGVSPITRTMAVRATYGEQIWVAHCDILNAASTAIRCVGLDTSTLAATTADTTLATPTGTATATVGVERVDATHCLATWTPAPAVGASMQWRNFTAVTAALGQTRTLQNCILASMPFTLAGQVCAQAIFTDAATPTMYCVDLMASDSSNANQAAQLRATVAPRVISATSSVLGSLFVPHVPTVGSDAWGGALTIRSGTDPNGLDLVKYSYGYDLHQSAQLGPCSYLSGGVPCVYDGKRVTEVGFVGNPAIPSFSANTTGTMATGTYEYALVWEWRDAAGQRKQSAPTFSGTINVTGPTGSVDFTSPVNLGLTLCQDSESGWLPNVALAVYRTIPTVATGVYCRIDSGNTDAARLSVPYGSTNFSFTDKLADASISANEQLYTTGNVLSGQIPSSFTSLITHNGRLVGIGDDEQTLWYSTAWDGGTTQPRFNDALTLTVPEGGRITGIASMDGQLVVFTKTKIFAIAGDGPDETGAGATWGVPRRLPGSIGHDADWRSIHASTKGVFFQHGSRIYLLSRSLDVEYFSQAVEQKLVTYPAISSVVEVPDQEQIRWTARPADGTQTGQVLVFDFVVNAWSYYSIYDSDSAVAGFGADSACLTSAGYLWLGQKGTPWFELTSTNLDPGSTWVTLTAETAWLKPGGIQGFARFRWANLLMEKGTDADMTISVGTDYNDSYSQTFSLTGAALNTNASLLPKPTMAVHVQNQKCSAIRFKISDATPTGGGVSVGIGTGYTLVGLQAELGIKTRLHRLAQAEKG